MNSVELTDAFRARPRFGVLALMVFLSFLLPHIPVLNWISGPITSFTTTVHEMSHAIACILTGGQVAGMSIVNDGEGHGGLTYCLGGWPFIVTQAGYIGTALIGSLLIMLAQFPRLSRYVLGAVGLGFAAGGLFMLGGLFSGHLLSGLASFLVAVPLGLGLVFVATKLNWYWANLLLLFLGVQTGLNALNDDGILITQAFGGMPGTWSDATSMQQLTMVPAPIWAAFWTLIALGLLGVTLRCCYKTGGRG